MTDRHTLDTMNSDGLDALYDALDGAYRERAHLVALLAAMTDGAVIAPAPDVDEPGWQIAYLTVGKWQASWHIAPRDAGLFRGVEHVAVDDPRAQWDGHTTDAKYARIRNHTRVREMNRRLQRPKPQPPAPADRVANLREVVRRLAAHANGFQDVLDDSDRGPWGRTVGADIAALQAVLGEARQDEAQAPVQCTAAVLRKPHGPHGWAAQPGMDPVRCPGFCCCDHPADEHTVYGCADGCSCEYLPSRKPAAVSQPGGEA